MIKKQMVRGFIIGLSYYIVWFAIDYIIVMIASISPSRKAYGILSAWWAALYLCSFINIGIKDIWYLTVPGILYAAYLGQEWHDYSGYSIVDNVTLFFFLLTPFLMNLLLVAIKKGLTKKKLGLFKR